MDDYVDRHLCLRCNTTIFGLEEYVNHRKQFCSTISLTSVPSELQHQSNNLIHEDDMDYRFQNFFTSLELQSSRALQPQPVKLLDDRISDSESECGDSFPPATHTGGKWRPGANPRSEKSIDGFVEQDLDDSRRTMCGKIDNLSTSQESLRPRKALSQSVRCSLCFVCVKSLDQHMQERHPDKCRICRACGKLFINIKRYREHRRTTCGTRRNHTSVKDVYHCEKCSAVFTTRSGFDYHKKYSCSDAEIISENATNIAGHVSGESTTVLSFACDQCESRFAQKTKLVEHKRIHSGEKPHCCHICDFSTARKYSLFRHMKSHQSTNSSKLFCCPYCSYSSALSEHLRQHVLHSKTHCNARLYHCSVPQCAFETNSYGEFRSHCFRSHGKKPIYHHHL